MAAAAALKAAKKELRSLMKQKLSPVTQDSIDTQSAAVYEGLTSLKPYQDAKRIGIYLSMPTGEIQTDAIVRHALENGKKVFVPYLHKALNPPPNTPRSVMDMVHLRSILDYDSLRRDSWGIPTINAEDVEAREHILGKSTERSGMLDVILMPGVAFSLDTEHGSIRRLGHGKGYYDYFLHRYSQKYGNLLYGPEQIPSRTVLLYGLALEEQFLEIRTDPPIPVDKHDHVLHGVLIGNGKLGGILDETDDRDS